MKYSLILLFVLITLFGVNRAAAMPDSIPTQPKRHIGKTLLPIVFYLPETGWAFGGLGQTSFRWQNEPQSSRPSQVILAAAYTLKRQILLYSSYQLYFKEERYRLIGELGYYRYFYPFYGIGPGTKLEDREYYRVNFPRFYNRFITRIGRGHFLGFGFKYDYFDIVHIVPGGIVDRGPWFGKKGGHALAGTISYLQDLRNHLYYPTRGRYLDLRLEGARAGWLSSESYLKAILDARIYIPLGDRAVLAVQYYEAWASEHTPFYYLPYISATPGIARGIRDRRYMDQHILNLQLEVRFPIYRRLYGVIFSSGTQVGKRWSRQSIKWAGGAGLRYVVDRVEQTRMRLDIAGNREGLNFYLTFNEAF